MVVPMPSGMMAPSPNSFSIWATVFFRVGMGVEHGDAAAACGLERRLWSAARFSWPWVVRFLVLGVDRAVLCERMNSIASARRRPQEVSIVRHAPA